MGSFIRQPSFGMGELGPSWYGRDDLDPYKYGLRTLKNFFVGKSGSVLNRPGTIRDANAYSNTKRSVLRAFAFSDDQNYVLEFSEYIMRAFLPTGGSALTFSSSSGAMLAVGLPTSGSQVQKFQAGVWSDVTTLGWAGTTGPTAIASDGVSRWVVVGLDGTTPKAAYSTDLGATWSAPVSLTAGFIPRAICYTGTRWIVVGDAGKWTQSNDGGATWAAVSQLAATALNLNIVAANGGLVVAMGVDGTAVKTSYSSDHGVNFGAAVTVRSYGAGYAPWSLGAVWTGSYWAIGCGAFKPATLRWQRSMYRAAAGAAAWTEQFYSGELITGAGSSSPAGCVVWNSTESKGVYAPGYANLGGIYTFDANVTVTFESSSKMYSLSVFNGTVYGRNYINDTYARSGTSWVYSATPNLATYGQSTAAIDSTTTTTIATSYTEAQLRSLWCIQSGDIVYIFCEGMPTQKLTRTGGTISAPVFSLVQLTRSLNTALAAPVVGTAGTGTGKAKEWSWKVTWIDQSYKESAASAAYSDATAKVYVDDPYSIQWTGRADARGYMVYRGRNGEYGWVGYVPATAAAPYTETFRDDGQLPLLTEPPPEGGDYVADANAAVAAFYQDRLAIANTLTAPNTLRLSATGQYQNHDLPRIYKSTSPMELTAASRQYEEIRALVPMRELLVLTSECEASLSGPGQNPLTPQTFDYKVHSQRGCAKIYPLVVGNSCLYVQKQGNAVRDLIYDVASDSYDTNDLMLLAEHILSGSGLTVVDWCYAQHPHSVIWCVLSDGSVASLSYLREMKQVAWARHDFTGTVEACCAVNNGTEDIPWFVVVRNSVRQIEHMASRTVTTVASGCFVDDAVAFSVNITRTVAVHHASGPLYGIANGAVIGPLTITGGNVTIPGSGLTTGYVGRQITQDFAALDVPGARERRKLAVRAIVELGNLPDISSSGASLQAGETTSDLVARPVSDIINNQLEILTTSSYNPGGRVVVRLQAAVPVEITGLIREVQVGE